MSSLQSLLEPFLLRELATLKRELEMYPSDSQLWELPSGLPNAAGTLALHVAGNLQHYVGALLGGSGYRRDREREFAARGAPREELLREIEAAERAIRETFPRLGEAQLAAPYPEHVRGRPLRTDQFLLQLAVHLAYHLGQVSYHRRIVTGNAKGADAVSSADLPALPFGTATSAP